MKYTKLFYLAIFLILIIFITLYFQWSYREGIANIDPSIVNSNVQNGPLSSSGLLSFLNNLQNQMSSLVINKINIVGTPDGKPSSTGQTQILLNGKIIPGVSTVSQLTQMLTGMINAMTSNAQSIDIVYTTK